MQNVERQALCSFEERSDVTEVVLTPCMLTAVAAGLLLLTSLCLAARKPFA